MESKLIKINARKPVHSDDRGDIVDVLNIPIAHVGYVTFTKGAHRGQHYHHRSTQYDYVLSGKLRLVVCRIDGSEREDHILTPHMMTEIPPGVVHTYIAEEESEMLDITTLSRADEGYEEDTVKVDLGIE